MIENFSQYEYNLEEIKEQLTIGQVTELVAELHGEPIQKGNVLICKTICHHSVNELDEAGHKLYYYDNTHLFRCYTGCAEPTFDIFELVRKVKERELGQEYTLPAAVKYVADYFGYSPNDRHSFDQLTIKDDLVYLSNLNRIKDISLQTQTVELKTYDGSFLKNLPRPVIQPWVEDNITKETMDYFDICYDPRNCGVVIPHYDINGGLIGVRERTLIQEVAKKYGKYMPMKIGKQMYNHPLSFSLYGIYQNQDNIRRARKAIVLEGEKSVLQLDNILGRENNIGVACCGSSFITYQAWLLIGLGVEEIIVGLDRQFKELNDKEHQKLVKNLKNIHYKYGKYVRISYLFDKEMITPYKSSPTDCGSEIFFNLYKNRVNLY